MDHHSLTSHLRWRFCPGILATDLLVVLNQQERTPLTNDAVTRPTLNLAFVIAQVVIKASGGRDGFGWVRPGVGLVHRPSTGAGDCLSWNCRSCLSIQRRLVEARRRHISECSGLYGELVSAKPVRTETHRIYDRCGCHAPAIHGPR